MQILPVGEGGTQPVTSQLDRQTKVGVQEGGCECAESVGVVKVDVRVCCGYCHAGVRGQRSAYYGARAGYVFASWAKSGRWERYGLSRCMRRSEV